MKVSMLTAVTAMLLAACSRSDTIHQSTAQQDYTPTEQQPEASSKPTTPAAHRFNNGLIIMPGSMPADDTARQLK